MNVFVRIAIIAIVFSASFTAGKFVGGTIWPDTQDTEECRTYFVRFHYLLGGKVEYRTGAVRVCSPLDGTGIYDKIFSSVAKDVPTGDVSFDSISLLE